MFRFLYAWLLYTWGGLHRYFGNQNSMRREHERAAHYFARAYEVDPTFHAARLQRAVLLTRELRRHEEAIAEFDALVAIEETHAAALLNRGLALQENGRFPEALNDIEAYLQLSPKAEFWEEAHRMAASLRAIVHDDEQP